MTYDTTSPFVPSAIGGPPAADPFARAIATMNGDPSAACACSLVLAESRGLVASLCASTTAIMQQTADALTRASALTWQGEAGDLFHARVAAATTAAADASAGAQATATLFAGDGVVT